MLTTPSRRLSSTLFLAFAYFLLAACGGSSGGGTPPVVTPPDTSPTPFTFAAAEDVEPGAKAASETITIEGIDTDASVTVSVENGQYRLNDGEFQSESTNAGLGDELTLQGTAPETPEETQTVSVTLGDYTTTFDVVAGSDTGAPEAAFVFPPPMTATEGETVIVRGTAEDEWSEVSRVTLTVNHEGGTNDYEVDTEDGFATWQKQVTLAPGENTITLQAEDALGNKLGEDEQQSVAVVRQNLVGAFPDDAVASEFSGTLAFDERHDRILISENSPRRIVAVDLETGNQSVFFEFEHGNEFGVRWISGLVIDAPLNRLLVGGDTQEGASVLSIDFDTKEVTVVNTQSFPTADQPAFDRPQDMMAHPSDPNQVFVLAAGDAENLTVLDLTSGTRSLVSSSDIPNSGPGLIYTTRISIDGTRGRALVGQLTDRGIFSIDLSTGVREVFLAEGNPEGVPESAYMALVSDSLNKRLFVADVVAAQVWSVDMETREVTVVSGEGIPNSYNPIKRVFGLAIAPNEEFLVALNQSAFEADALYAIDVVTGERVVLAKTE